MTITAGDRLIHKSFGVGQVTHVFDNGSNKVHIAVKFPGIGQKILDPRLAPLERVMQ